MTNHCSACGAPIRGRWERLSKGLVVTLIKFKQEVIRLQSNKINPNQIEGMSHTEKANFQKLRFHALVAKFKTEGVHEAGYWLLTKRGNEFLKGQITVPRRVFVLRNHVESHDEICLSIQNIMRSEFAPTFDGIFEFDYERYTKPLKQPEFFTEFTRDSEFAA